jgi:hypothetical protein
MATIQEMRTSRAAGFAWIIMLGLAIWVVGLYPTYHWSGKRGLGAQVVAFFVVLIATGSSVFLITMLARRGPKVAAVGMLLSGIARLVLIVASIFIVRWLFVLPLVTLVVWMGLFYITMFGGEVIWMTRALSHDNFLVALGDINRDEEFMPKQDTVNETT